MAVQPSGHVKSLMASILKLAVGQADVERTQFHQKRLKSEIVLAWKSEQRIKHKKLTLNSISK